MKKALFSDLLQKYVIVGTITFYLCVILLFAGIVSFSFHGFAVDTSGVIYIGQSSKIEAIQGREKIHEIRKFTDRGYVFTIHDDALLIASGADVALLDLLGTKVISQWKDETLTLSRKLKKEMMQFVSFDGVEYTASRPLGRLTIYNAQKIVYQMPFVDYLFMIAFYLSIPAFIISVHESRQMLTDFLSVCRSNKM